MTSWIYDLPNEFPQFFVLLHRNEDWEWVRIFNWKSLPHFISERTQLGSTRKNMIPIHIPLNDIITSHAIINRDRYSQIPSSRKMLIWLYIIYIYCYSSNRRKACDFYRRHCHLSHKFQFVGCKFHSSQIHRKKEETKTYKNKLWWTIKNKRTADA